MARLDLKVFSLEFTARGSGKFGLAALAFALLFYAKDAPTDRFYVYTVLCGLAIMVLIFFINRQRLVYLRKAKTPGDPEGE